MNTMLTVEIKEIYGNKMVYPACELSRQFCGLLKTKTLTEDAQKIIKEMGFTFIVKSQEL